MLCAAISRHINVGHSHRKNYMTKEEALQKIEELKEFLEGVERWKPKSGENYYYVPSYGVIEYCSYSSSSGVDAGRFDLGNMFKTREQADFFRKRLESMASRGKMPEYNENYYFFDFNSEEVEETDLNAAQDIANYWIGNCHETMEAAREWGKKYAKYFSK
jgi:hypothetical protein